MSSRSKRIGATIVEVDECAEGKECGSPLGNIGLQFQKRNNKNFGIYLTGFS